MSRRAIFLDRDGVINVDKAYVYKIDDFQYIDGAVEGLRKLSELGYLLIVISNQSGIARGMFGEDEYKRLESWMVNDLAGKGVEIAAVYHCPYLGDECECRKPKTGMFWQAKRDFDIDMDRSFAIGDRLRDLSICEETKAKGILFGHESKEYICFMSWKEVVDYIKGIADAESCNNCSNL